MEPVQIVVIGVSIVLTSLFIALGVQFWFILKEIRGSLQRVNSMLDDAAKVTHAVGGGLTNMTGLMNGLKSGMNLVTTLRGKGE